jgi:hypothetical protein
VWTRALLCTGRDGLSRPLASGDIATAQGMNCVGTIPELRDLLPEKIDPGHKSASLPAIPSRMPAVSGNRWTFKNQAPRAYAQVVRDPRPTVKAYGVNCRGF